MADINPAATVEPRIVPSDPRSIPIQTSKASPAPMNSGPTSSGNLRGGHLTLDTFSPVNQNGSFEFDRVIKSGELLKRNKRTKVWKSVYLVLRPNLLSIYKDKEETKLRHQINLSDITAVARQKDPRRKEKHVFGVFSPSRNFHLEAPTEKEAQQWVECIRREARFDEEEEEMILASPTGAKSAYNGFGRSATVRQPPMAPLNRMDSSSSDQEGRTQGARPRDIPSGLRRTRDSSTFMDYSGNEDASYTDFSDTGPVGLQDSSLSISQQLQTGGGVATPKQDDPVYLNQVASLPQASTQSSGINVQQDEERVVYHGWLYVLKSKGAVKQWKRLWVVLRPKSLALYKDEDEYEANLVIPFNTILDAVDLDPLSRSKRFCMQVIAEDKSYRFCAPSDEAVSKWLGSFKSLLVKRKEAEMQRAANTQR